MNTIVLIIIFLVLGVIFGFIFARVIFAISTWLLKKKVEKEAKNSSQQFFYKKQPYDLKKEIEYEQNQRKKKFSFKNPFKKKVKGGISDYGSTTARNNESVVKESVLGNNGNVGNAPIPDNTTPTNPTTPTAREQGSPDSPPRTELGRNFNRNLFEKGK